MLESSLENHQTRAGEIAFLRRDISSKVSYRKQLMGRPDYIVNPQIVPAQVRRDIQLLSILISAEGRRLGGLVTAEKKKNERR